MTNSELTLLVNQLQTALLSHTVIEQAKGFIAATRGIDPDEAFRRIRAYARSHNLNLRDVCRSVVSRTLLI